MYLHLNVLSGYILYIELLQVEVKMSYLNKYKFESKPYVDNINRDVF